MITRDHTKMISRDFAKKLKYRVIIIIGTLLPLAPIRYRPSTQEKVCCINYCSIIVSFHSWYIGQFLYCFIMIIVQLLYCFIIFLFHFWCIVYTYCYNYTIIKNIVLLHSILQISLASISALQPFRQRASTDKVE